MMYHSRQERLEPGQVRVRLTVFVRGRQLALRTAAVFTLSLGAIMLHGCTQNPVSSAANGPCSHSWFEAVESKVATGDGQGHGPDIGTQEWRSVVEFKLGIRGSSLVPDSESSEWCRYIDRLVFNEAG